MSVIKTIINKQWDGNIVKAQGKKVVQRSAFELGLVVEGQAKLLCAVRYGYLAASITTQAATHGTELESPGKYAQETPPPEHRVDTFKKIASPKKDNEVLTGTAVDYGPYVEFPSKKSLGQPFLRPAADLAQGKKLIIVQINGKYYFKKYLKKEHLN